MKISEWLLVLGLVVVVAGGAVWLGRLIGGLDPGEAIRQINEAKDKAISEIQATNQQASAGFGDFRKRRWCNMAESRRTGEAYVNDTSLPIELAITTSGAKGRCFLELGVGALRLTSRENNPEWEKQCGASITVPPGSTYTLASEGHEHSVIVDQWWELRPEC